MAKLGERFNPVLLGDREKGERRRRLAYRPGRPICGVCGYNARGVVGQPCPECGDFLDRKRWTTWPAAGSQQRSSVFFVAGHAIVMNLLLLVVAGTMLFLAWDSTVGFIAEFVFALAILSGLAISWVGFGLAVYAVRGRIKHGSRRWVASVLVVIVLLFVIQSGLGLGVETRVP